MSAATPSELCARNCVPCEGGVPPLTTTQIAAQIAQLPHWRVTEDGIRIRRDWRMKNFVAAIEFFRAVCDLAEAEGHHPDLHLVGYRNVTIEIWTHAIGGLSDNDFILAAKIDQLPASQA